MIILISAMRQGPTPRRVRELSQRFGADRRTIARWQVLWREHFPQTPFWKAARARLAPIVEIITLPYSLVVAFLQPQASGARRLGDEDDDFPTIDSSLERSPSDTAWARLLRFLAPISIPGALKIKLS